MSDTLKRPADFPQNFGTDNFKTTVRDAMLEALDAVVLKSGIPLPERHGGAADSDLPMLFKALDAHVDRLLERAGWTHVSAQLPHNYIDASQDIAAYCADLADRQAVTVAYAYEHLTDEQIWRFIPNVEGSGGIWQELVGIDMSTDGDGYTIEFGRVGDKRVPGSHRIFTSRKTLAAHGLPTGVPGGPPGFKTQPAGAGRG